MAETVKVIIECPARVSFAGFFAAGLFFPAGIQEFELPAAKVAEIEGEIARKESILKLVRADAPAPKIESRKGR